MKLQTVVYRDSMPVSEVTPSSQACFTRLPHDDYMLVDIRRGEEKRIHIIFLIYQSMSISETKKKIKNGVRTQKVIRAYSLYLEKVLRYYNTIRMWMLGSLCA